MCTPGLLYVWTCFFGPLNDMNSSTDRDMHALLSSLLHNDVKSSIAFVNLHMDWRYRISLFSRWKQRGMYATCMWIVEMLLVLSNDESLFLYTPEFYLESLVWLNCFMPFFLFSDFNFLCSISFICFLFLFSLEKSPEAICIFRRWIVSMHCVEVILRLFRQQSFLSKGLLHL